MYTTKQLAAYPTTKAEFATTKCTVTATKRTITRASTTRMRTTIRATTVIGIVVNTTVSPTKRNSY